MKKFPAAWMLVTLLLVALLGPWTTATGAADRLVAQTKPDAKAAPGISLPDLTAMPAAGPRGPVGGTALPGWSFQEVYAPKDPGRGLALALDGAGRPHLAYGGDRLYYAWHDGSMWHYETVDGAYGVGGGVSLALDANLSEGEARLHISYYDLLQQDLKYAFNDGAGWQLTTVDSQDDAGEYTSLALDGAGLPHISYSYCRERSWEGCTYSELRYARFDGSAWFTETVDSGDADHPNSMALDAAGLPHIGYLDHWTIRYAHHDGTAWTIDAVESVYRPGYDISLALDSLDQPHLVYARHDFYDPDLKYAHYDGTTWRIESVSRRLLAYRYSLVLDKADHPHISFDNSLEENLQYAVHDGTAWYIETAWGPGSDRYNWGTALALDAGGRPYIAFHQVRLGIYRSNIAVATSDGAAWQSEIVDQGGSAGDHGSLALDAADLPHISYVECRNSCSLTYAAFDGSAWQTATVDIGLGEAGGHSSLALDSLGRPHISYHVAVATGTQELRYAAYDGTAWHTATVAPGRAGYTSLALDAADRPHISYYNYVDSGLKYASYDGTTWHIETVAGAGTYGGFTSLALDALGHPHISFSDGTSLCYAYFDGATWSVETLDGSGVMGTPLALDASVEPVQGRPHVNTNIMDTSLALDAAGQPHISYYVRPSNQVGVLKYAHFDGMNWNIETVEPNIQPYEGFAEHAVDISLALDAAARPRISYCSYRPGYGCDDLRYAYWDGTSWYTQTVDSAGYVGQGTSLALDSAGRPHISYHTDYPGSHLRYAVAECVPMAELAVVGPGQLPLGISGLFTAAYSPPTATAPLITWPDGMVGQTVLYSWAATGTHALTATAASACSQLQDVLTVTVFCQPPAGAAVNGPSSLVAGQAGTFRATPVPITASLPLTWTWDNGTVGAIAVYSWTMTGTYTLTVTATNVCGQGWGEFAVQVLAEWPNQLYLPLVVRNE